MLVVNAPSPSAMCLRPERRACVIDRCAACASPCVREQRALVGFCDECLEASDPRTFLGYPEDWVTYGGGD